MRKITTSGRWFRWQSPETDEWKLPKTVCHGDDGDDSGTTGGPFGGPESEAAGLGLVGSPDPGTPGVGTEAAGLGLSGPESEAAGLGLAGTGFGTEGTPSDFGAFGPDESGMASAFGPDLSSSTFGPDESGMASAFGPDFGVPSDFGFAAYGYVGPSDFAAPASFDPGFTSLDMGLPGVEEDMGVPATATQTVGQMAPGMAMASPTPGMVAALGPSLAQSVATAFSSPIGALSFSTPELAEMNAATFSVAPGTMAQQAIGIGTPSTGMGLNSAAGMASLADENSFPLLSEPLVEVPGVGVETQREAAVQAEAADQTATSDFTFAPDIGGASPYDPGFSTDFASSFSPEFSGFAYNDFQPDLGNNQFVSGDNFTPTGFDNQFSQVDQGGFPIPEFSVADQNAAPAQTYDVGSGFTNFAQYDTQGFPDFTTGAYSTGSPMGNFATAQIPMGGETQVSSLGGNLGGYDQSYDTGQQYAALDTGTLTDTGALTAGSQFMNGPSPDNSITLGPGSMFYQASEGASPGDINAAKTEADTAAGEAPNKATELPEVVVTPDETPNLSPAGSATAESVGNQADMENPSGPLGGGTETPSAQAESIQSSGAAPNSSQSTTAESVGNQANMENPSGPSATAPNMEPTSGVPYLSATQESQVPFTQNDQQPYTTAAQVPLTADELFAPYQGIGAQPPILGGAQLPAQEFAPLTFPTTPLVSPETNQTFLDYVGKAINAVNPISEAEARGARQDFLQQVIGSRSQTETAAILGVTPQQLASGLLTQDQITRTYSDTARELRAGIAEQLSDRATYERFAAIVQAESNVKSGERGVVSMTAMAEMLANQIVGKHEGSVELGIGEKAFTYPGNNFPALNSPNADQRRDARNEQAEINQILRTGANPETYQAVTNMLLGSTLIGARDGNASKGVNPPSSYPDQLVVGNERFVFEGPAPWNASVPTRGQAEGTTAFTPGVTATAATTPPAEAPAPEPFGPDNADKPGWVQTTEEGVRTVGPETVQGAQVSTSIPNPGFGPIPETGTPGAWAELPLTGIAGPGPGFPASPITDTRDQLQRAIDAAPPVTQDNWIDVIRDSYGVSPFTPGAEPGWLVDQQRQGTGGEFPQGPYFPELAPTSAGVVEQSALPDVLAAPLAGVERSSLPDVLAAPLEGVERAGALPDIQAAPLTGVERSALPDVTPQTLDQAIIDAANAAEQSPEARSQAITELTPPNMAGAKEVYDAPFSGTAQPGWLVEQQLAGKAGEFPDVTRDVYQEAVTGPAVPSNEADAERQSIEPGAVLMPGQQAPGETTPPGPAVPSNEAKAEFRDPALVTAPNGTTYIYPGVSDVERYAIEAGRFAPATIPGTNIVDTGQTERELGRSFSGQDSFLQALNNLTFSPNSPLERGVRGPDIGGLAPTRGAQGEISQEPTDEIGDYAKIGHGQNESASRSDIGQGILVEPSQELSGSASKAVYDAPFSPLAQPGWLVEQQTAGAKSGEFGPPPDTGTTEWLAAQQQEGVRSGEFPEGPVFAQPQELSGSASKAVYEAPSQAFTIPGTGEYNPLGWDLSRPAGALTNEGLATMWPGTDKWWSDTSATKNAQPYQAIVIHQTASTNMETQVREMERYGVGYAYIIDKDGKIYQFGDPENTRSNQIKAGESSARTSDKDLNNTNTLGIALTGNNPTPQQIDALRTLVPQVQEALNIPDRVVAHGEIQNDEGRPTMGAGSTPEGALAVAALREGPAQQPSTTSTAAGERPEKTAEQQEAEYVAPTLYPVDASRVPTSDKTMEELVRLTPPDQLAARGKTVEGILSMLPDPQMTWAQWQAAHPYMAGFVESDLKNFLNGLPTAPGPIPLPVARPDTTPVETATGQYPQMTVTGPSQSNTYTPPGINEINPIAPAAPETPSTTYSPPAAPSTAAPSVPESAPAAYAVPQFSGIQAPVNYNSGVPATQQPAQNTEKLIQELTAYDAAHGTNLLLRYLELLLGGRDIGRIQ